MEYIDWGHMHRDVRSSVYIYLVCQIKIFISRSLVQTRLLESENKTSSHGLILY